MITFLSPQIELEKIQPVFEKGTQPILRAVLMNLGFPYLELVLFLMIYPYVNQIKEAEKGFFVGILISGIMLSLITILCISVLGADEAANEHFPSFTLAQKINIGDFIQRVEAIMAGLWVISIFLSYKSVIMFPY